MRRFEARCEGELSPISSPKHSPNKDKVIFTLLFQKSQKIFSYTNTYFTLFLKRHLKNTLQLSSQKYYFEIIKIYYYFPVFIP